MLSQVLKLKNFITAAETAWFTIQFSRKVGRPVIGPNGDQFRFLGPRFNSRKKIFRFLRKFWSPAFARRIMCNLPLATINRHLATLDNTDVPDAPRKAKSIRIIFSLSDSFIIRAVLENSTNQVIYYRIQKSKCGLVITNRTNTNDFRYRPCK
ncbi:hypothetical protein [Paenibacillus taihuensis]|uniref:hypothetical protein n=1 Tax=Paenibacillus taihuensis TaxID=1156355 RepID=UPI0011C06625|nr:hypothetical protein [Paenibacillus taihuensis]